MLVGSRRGLAATGGWLVRHSPRGSCPAAMVFGGRFRNFADEVLGVRGGVRDLGQDVDVGFGALIGICFSVVWEAAVVSKAHQCVMRCDGRGLRLRAA